MRPGLRPLLSTRQTGNRHENTVCAEAEALGYATFAARGSRGPVDVLCFDGHHRQRGGPGPLYIERLSQELVPLVIQVGTTNKPIASTLAELDQAPRPIGSLCLVARRHRKRLMLPSGKKSKALSVVWSWHSAAGTFATLKEALDGR